MEDFRTAGVAPDWPPFASRQPLPFEDPLLPANEVHPHDFHRDSTMGGDNGVKWR